MNRIRLKTLLNKNGSDQLNESDRSLLNEAEEISFNDLEKSDQDLVKNILKIFKVRHPSVIFDGIHGKIVSIENDQHGSNSYRFDLNEIKQLSKLKIRWVTGGIRDISVGF